MKSSEWKPPYTSTKVAIVVHWLCKPVEWPGPLIDLMAPDALEKCLAVFLPYYDVMIRRAVTGELRLFLDDFGGDFRQR